MKKTVIFIMSLVLILTGCSIHQLNHVKNDKTEEALATSSGLDGETTDDNLPIDEEEKKTIKATCISIADSYKTLYQSADKGEDVNISIDEKSEEKIFKVLSESGIAVICRDIPSNMENKDGVQKFLADAKQGKAGETVIYEVNQDGGFSSFKFDYDGENMTLTSANVVWVDDETANVSYMAKCQINKWDYTENGWFCYELCVPKTQDIMNGNQFIRVDSLSEECLSYCSKYITPIGYQGNNLFLCNWDETDFTKIDFPGLFEYFYVLKNGNNLDVADYDNGVKKDEFENLMTTFLTVSPASLEEMDCYHTDTKRYDWKKLGCGNYAPDSYGEPEPEGVRVTKNEDGTITLLVNAVWEGKGLDKAFSSEVTIRVDANEKVTYLSNHVVEDENNVIPQYTNRLS